MTHEALEAQLLQLPPAMRAHLARILIESLDAEPELDPTWIEEVRKRAEELADGSVESIPASVALSDARRRLAE